jgi:hypothetical protein
VVSVATVGHEIKVLIYDTQPSYSNNLDCRILILTDSIPLFYVFVYVRLTQHTYKYIIL